MRATRAARRARTWQGHRAGWRGLVLVATLAPGPLVAQVGYEPGRSPYHDIPRGADLLFAAGYLSGGRGSLGVGSSSGPTGGVRYEAALGVIGVALGVSYASTTRLVIDPTRSPATRTSGPMTSGVVLADVGLRLLLTGKKTWRGLAPYVGGASGLAIGGRAAGDTSGYTFGTKFTFGPDVGVHWYPGGRLTGLIDFRAMTWRLSYPASYQKPDLAGDPTVLAPGAATTEWTWHPWITIGVGWTF